MRTKFVLDFGLCFFASDTRIQSNEKNVQKHNYLFSINDKTILTKTTIVRTNDPNAIEPR